MPGDMFTGIVIFFVIVLLFDVSFNMRRVSKHFDRILRKLSEIADLLQK
jgi:hypothetical protein